MITCLVTSTCCVDTFARH